jgi:predicted dinucleotide-binding enzyme
VAALLPGARVVKAFNTLYYVTLADEAGRDGDRLAVPVAGDDVEAVATVACLVRDAGFDPVTLNAIDRARDFDPGTSVFGKSMSAAALRRSLGVLA